MTRLRIPLSLLLLLFLPISIGALLVRVSLEQRPIVWQPYSEARKNELVDEGETVLVFCKPLYSSLFYEAENSLDHPEIRRSFHAGKFRALVLEYGGWSGSKIRTVFRKYGFTKGPIILLFSPGQEGLRLDPYSSDDLLRHVPRVTSRAVSQKLLAGLLLVSVVVISLAYWHWVSRTRRTVK